MGYYKVSPLDVPYKGKVKRVILYAHGLKVYGQIPYLLQRRLHAEFISDTAPFMGGHLMMNSNEMNYTVIPLARPDGRPQRKTAVKALIKWLYDDAGFEWAVAEMKREFWRTDWLDAPNWGNWPPETFTPALGEHESPLRQLLLGDRNDALHHSL